VKEYVGMNWLRIGLNKIFAKVTMDLKVCEGRKEVSSAVD
jgi:hypothetical protein